MRIATLFFVLFIFCSACGNKDKQAEKILPDMRFERTKWDVKDNNGNYTYRGQMINDLLQHHQWAGIKKDSVLQMLGQPDAIEEGNLMYNYKKEPFLGGLGTKIEAIVFELAPDSTVKLARLNDGGWD